MTIQIDIALMSAAQVCVCARPGDSAARRSGAGQAFRNCTRDQRQQPRAALNLDATAWLALVLLLFSAGDTYSQIGLADSRLLVQEQSAAPWDGSDATRDNKASSSFPETASSAREILVNVTRQELEALLNDSSAITSSPESPNLAPVEEVYLKTLHRLPRFRPEDVDRFSRRTDGVPWSDVLNQMARFQMALFQLEGRVTWVRRRNVDLPLAEYLNLSHYFEVAVSLRDGPEVWVIAREIPEAWPLTVPISEPTRCWGLLMQAISTDSADKTKLVFASPRMAWYPDREISGAGVGRDQLLLVDLGMDISLIDGIRARNGKDLRSELDQRCFYPMLAAAGRVAPAVLKSRERPLDLSAILQHPRQLHGELFTIEGSARRITEVSVSRPYLRELLGSDRYYQIDMFVPLGNRRVRLGTSADDREAPEFTDNFPVTVCVRQLPAGLKPTEKTSKVIRLTAFFFKLWSYRSEYVREFGDAQKQLSPMFVGLEPVVVTSRRSAGSLAAFALAGVGILAFVGTTIGLWIYRVGDRKFEQRALNRRFELAPGQTIKIDQTDSPGSPGEDKISDD